MVRHWFKHHSERLLREGGKSVKFAFIDAEKARFPISRMCSVLGVSQSGFFAWQERPACLRQQQDMVESLVSATRKQARFLPSGHLLKEILCIAWVIADETFRTGREEGSSMT